MKHQLHYLGWDKPIADLAVEFLSITHKTGPLDISKTLIVVPTAHSGRRLREKLAYYAADKNSLVFPAQIVTPEFIANTNLPQTGIAQNVQSLAVWIEVLLNLKIEKYSALFPVPPSVADFHWALSVARQLTTLRHNLGAYGYTFGDVVGMVARDFEELDRWHDLAGLEQKYLHRLESIGLFDKTMAQKEAVKSSANIPGIERIVLIAVPDPIPRTIPILEACSESIPVHVCVHAPKSLADHFDNWGRPTITEKWNHFRIPITDESIYLVGTANQQSEKVFSLLIERSENNSVEKIALIAADEKVIPYLEQKIRKSRIPTFFPGGIQVNNHELYLFIASFHRFFRHQNFESFSSLIRHPQIIETILSENPDISVVNLLEETDEYQNEFLPFCFIEMSKRLETFNDSYQILKFACRTIQQFLDAFRSENWVDSILGILSRCHCNRKLNLKIDNDRNFSDVSSVFLNQLSALNEPCFDSQSFESSEKLQLILQTIKDQKYFPEREPHSIDLSGWLEIQWEDAPHMIVSGMNSGLVPETIIGDPFLPESLRNQLKMKNNELRFARDAYILAAVTYSRKIRGSVDIVVAKTNELGEPLKPSRLLFLCEDEVLPQRALKLFGQVKDSYSIPPREIDFKLVPNPPHKLPKKISVTAFRDYLDCPFRFYLKHNLKMKTMDDRKTELDAFDFGEICHRALEEFGRKKSLRDSTDANSIADFLISSAELRTNKWFGSNRPVAITIQLEAIKQRLIFAAHLQVQNRKQGWKIAEVEKGISLENSYGSKISITGKIDRIDIHEETQQVRVIDYKTSDVAVSPEKVHLKKVASLDDTEAFGNFQLGKKSLRWTDLQLPLYCLLLKNELGKSIECGYFNLPKSAADAGLQIWIGLDQHLLKHAETCAQGVIRCLEEQIFWPARSTVEFDRFSPILFDNPRELVDPSNLAGGF